MRYYSIANERVSVYAHTMLPSPSLGNVKQEASQWRQPERNVKYNQSGSGSKLKERRGAPCWRGQSLPSSRFHRARSEQLKHRMRVCGRDESEERERMTITRKQDVCTTYDCPRSLLLLPIRCRSVKRDKRRRGRTRAFQGPPRTLSSLFPSALCLLNICLLLLPVRPPLAVNPSFRRLRADAPVRRVAVAHDFQMRIASEPM